MAGMPVARFSARDHGPPSRLPRIDKGHEVPADIADVLTSIIRHHRMTPVDHTNDPSYMPARTAGTVMPGPPRHDNDLRRRARYMLEHGCPIQSPPAPHTVMRHLH